MKTISNFCLLLMFVVLSALLPGCEKDSLDDVSPAVMTREQDLPLTPTNKFYTAYAFGEMSFINAGLSDTEWGWVSKYQKKDDTLIFPLYIRDEHYEYGDGINVGEFKVYYLNDKIVADFYTRRGFALMHTNLYASHKKPVTCNPAYFTEHHSLIRNNFDRMSVYNPTLPVYIIGHATVVKTQ